jgi:tetratricopeptide (TPR) repeat protein
VMLLFAVALQAGALLPSESCATLAASDPVAAERRATIDRSATGRACLGLAFAGQGRFAEAGPAFEEAARVSELARDGHAARYWAQAGNAWLAGAEPAKARAALDAALGAGTLVGQEQGEAFLDRARALVAAGDAARARVDLDAALRLAAADPLAWLLSATLARRTGDLVRARSDIAEALKRSPDDASVQLEAGNVAAAAGDAAGAQAAWREAAKVQPGSPAALSAQAALAQF